MKKQSTSTESASRVCYETRRGDDLEAAVGRREILACAQRTASDAGCLRWETVQGRNCCAHDDRADKESRLNLFTHLLTRPRDNPGPTPIAHSDIRRVVEHPSTNASFWPTLDRGIARRKKPCCLRLREGKPKLPWPDTCATERRHGVCGQHGQD
jgi:hypothetical protein